MENDKLPLPSQVDARPTSLHPAPFPLTPDGQLPGDVFVNVTANNLNVHPSSISALERIAEKNPDIAKALIKSADRAVQGDNIKYGIGACAALVIALAVIIGSAAVLIEVGLFAGILFFVSCVVASAIVTAIFTGKAQDISWTVKAIPTAFRRSEDDSESAD